MVIGVATQQQIERTAEGVCALAEGAVETVAAVGAYAAHDYVRGTLHTARAAELFAEGGRLLAPSGRARRRRRARLRGYELAPPRKRPRRVQGRIDARGGRKRYPGRSCEIDISDEFMGEVAHWLDRLGLKRRVIGSDPGRRSTRIRVDVAPGHQSKWLDAPRGGEIRITFGTLVGAMNRVMGFEWREAGRS